jgi:adenosyl cobinamide kinase/adenosyl cobinamide phosphate guanylyltransferase
VILIFGGAFQGKLDYALSNLEELGFDPLLHADSQPDSCGGRTPGHLVTQPTEPCTDPEPEDTSSQELLIYNCREDVPDIDFNADIINDLHLAFLAQIRAGLDVQDVLNASLPKLKNKILIVDDIMSGVVPLDAQARAWREATGRGLGLLVKHANQVVRVFCGIGTRIK